MKIDIKINAFKSYPGNFTSFKNEKLFTKKIDYFRSGNSIVCKNGNIEIKYNHNNDHFFFSKYINIAYLNKYYSSTWLKKVNNSNIIERVKFKFLSLKYKIFLNKILNYKINVLKKHVHKNSLVLDIGSGSGEILYKLSDNIKTGYNFEMSKYERTHTKKNIYFIYNKLNFLKKKIKKNSLDLIILHHSFEHILNHEEVFKIINYLIKDNGKLVIAVPDNKNLDLIKAFLFLPHIHNFSKKSLQFVLNKNKFYVEKTLDFKIDEIFFICSKKKQKIIKFKSSTLKQHFRRYFNSNKIQNPMKSIKMSSYPKQLSKNTNYLSRIIDVDLKVKSNKKDILQFKNSNNKSYFFLK